MAPYIVRVKASPISPNQMNKSQAFLLKVRYIGDRDNRYLTSTLTSNGNQISHLVQKGTGVKSMDFTCEINLNFKEPSINYLR